MSKQSPLFSLFYLLLLIPGAILAQQASVQLPNCLEVNPLNTAGQTSRKFEIHNACGKTISEVVYARSYKTNERKTETVIIAEEFLSTIHWSPSEYNANGFSAIAQPSRRAYITLTLPQKAVNDGSSANSLDMFILALGFSNGEIEGSSAYFGQIVSLRRSRLARTKEELRILKELSSPGRLEAMCSADEASREAELTRMGAISITFFSQQVRNACANQSWKGTGHAYLVAGLRSAEMLLNLIRQQGEDK